MPANTKTSQNKKKKQLDSKQNLKASTKKQSYKNTQNKKTIRNKSGVKKDTVVQSVQEKQIDLVQTNSIQSIVPQEESVSKKAEPVVMISSTETFIEKDKSSVGYVILLLICLAVMIVGIRLSYLQQGTTQTVVLEETVLPSVQVLDERNGSVVSSIEEENEKIISKTAETIGETQPVKTTETDIKDLEQEKYLQGASEVSAVLEKILTNKSYPVLGNPEGKYIIVDFFDYTCQWCKKTNYMLDKYITDGKAPNVRLIAIPTPVMGDQSIVVAAYALASMKQNKFAEFHQALTHSGMTLSLDNLLKIAETVGLDVNKLNEDVDNMEIFNQLEKNRSLLAQLKAHGIPYLIVNGELHAGALVGENLRLVIEQSNQ